MIVTAFIGSLLTAQASCLPDVSALGLAGAAARMQAAAQRCDEAVVGGLYLTGLMAAEEAWRQGGTEESLAPVRAAAAALVMRSAQSDSAEVAQLVLLAAAAAAQNERDEMALYLAQAIQVERLLRATRQAGAPYLSAFEAAGDLWMRVDRYADAQRAYALAAEEIGSTPRIAAGAARAARRLIESAPAATPR